MKTFEGHTGIMPKTDQEIYSAPYTRQDAIRDTQEARAELQREYNSGAITIREYAEAYPSTSFMDLAE